MQSGDSGGATSLPQSPMVISHSPHGGKEGGLELEKESGNFRERVESMHRQRNL